MAMRQGMTRTWRKSSYSGGTGACLEVLIPVRDGLAVRDSKAPAGPRLGFGAGSWSAFLAVLDDKAFTR
ncbi:DUF397 domain-containing protein [Streptomyces sp. PT12]|uniref:DUF397 domain-containing protein n=1 Tax=Streptomyces sp. PT12 TaxID=1510197 RepID=UPI000DE249BD|nr:DUF397 domain-containing protein [Streptomyces sp. PT12]RBM16912.1 DUF397 domain-containing protein [Streptomyces sp. PT12]